jgi:hypothetical protein
MRARSHGNKYGLYVYKSPVKFQCSVVYNELAAWLLCDFFKNAFELDKLHDINPLDNSEE